MLCLLWSLSRLKRAHKPCRLTVALSLSRNTRGHKALTLGYNCVVIDQPPRVERRRYLCVSQLCVS